jgi:hypothetical protein
VPETCRELKNGINNSIKSGASSCFSARNKVSNVIVQGSFDFGMSQQTD